MSTKYQDLILKQYQLCKSRNIPLFIPSNGVCWKCRKQVFEDPKTAEKADKEHITGCPFCYYSFDN